MKRISAVILAVVISCMLCINTNSILNIDRIHVNNNELDKSDNVMSEDPIKIEKGDRIYILGWAFNGSSNLKKIVYSVNGGEDVECEDNYKDRPDVAAALGADASFGNHAGFGTNDTEDGKPGMFALSGIEDLKPGFYTLRIKAVYEDGSFDTKDYNLDICGEEDEPHVAEKSEDQWLCGADPGTAMQPGFWFNPVGEPDDRYVTFTFTANGWFDGVKGFYYCSNPPANPELGLEYSHMNVELIKDGSVVALAELSAFGDFWSTVNFGKSFGPGVYSLRYSCKSGSGIANNCWCVIGFCGGYGDCTYDANVPTPGEGSYPVLMLTGAYPAEDVPATGPTEVREGPLTLFINDYYYFVDDCDNDASGKIVIPEIIESDGINVPVKEIGEFAFSNCRNITGVTIPKSVTDIGFMAFYNCSSLKSVEIPKSVTMLQYATFKNCCSLTDVAIPDSVVSIDESVFKGCDSLKTVKYSGSEEQWNEIYIGRGNDPLRNATIIFNYSGSVPGDCSGDGMVDNKDVVVLFRYVSGTDKVEDETAYDFNGDGVVDNKDVVSLFRYVSSN